MKVSHPFMANKIKLKMRRFHENVMVSRALYLSNKTMTKKKDGAKGVSWFITLPMAYLSFLFEQF